MSVLLNPYALGAGVVTDPSFSSVVLLVGGNGVDASTSFTDESSFAHALTANGNAQVDTAQSVFGGASILLDGSGDWVSAGDSAHWDMGSGEFTVEGFVMFASGTAADRAIVGQWDVFDPAFGVSTTSGGRFDFSVYDPAVGLRRANANFVTAANTWYYFCGQRILGSPDTVSLHTGVPGGTATQLASQTIVNGHALGNSGEQMRIGAFGGSSRQYLNGWVDEVRVTKGVARYGTGSFSVPTAAFPRS